MPLSLFTTPRSKPSGRLQAVARMFQLSGIVSGAMLIMLPFMLANLPSRTSMGVRGLSTMMFYGVALAASNYLIGRGLVRRERWSGVVAGIALTLPFAVRLYNGLPIPLSLDTVSAVAGLAILVSTHREFRSVVESSIDDSDPDDDTSPLTPRNRGYGEPRSLPLENIPISPTTATTTPLPIRNQRAD